MGVFPESTEQRIGTRVSVQVLLEDSLVYLTGWSAKIEALQGLPKRLLI